MIQSIVACNDDVQQCMATARYSYLQFEMKSCGVLIGRVWLKFSESLSKLENTRIQRNSRLNPSKWTQTRSSHGPHYSRHSFHQIAEDPFIIYQNFLFSSENFFLNKWWRRWKEDECAKKPWKWPNKRIMDLKVV
mgnify:CR=1 FL=1